VIPWIEFSGHSRFDQIRFSIIRVYDCRWKECRIPKIRDVTLRSWEVISLGSVETSISIYTASLLRILRSSVTSQCKHRNLPEGCVLHRIAYTPLCAPELANRSIIKNVGNKINWFTDRMLNSYHQQRKSFCNC